MPKDHAIKESANCHLAQAKTRQVEDTSQLLVGQCSHVGVSGRVNLLSITACRWQVDADTVRPFCRGQRLNIANAGLLSPNGGIEGSATFKKHIDRQVFTGNRVN